MKHIKKFLLCSLLVVLMGFAYQPAFAAGKVNINTATATQLTEVKGIGPKTAEKIVEYRKKHKFTSIDELTKVKGIGDKNLAKIRNQVTVKAEKSKKKKKK